MTHRGLSSYRSCTPFAFLIRVQIKNMLKDFESSHVSQAVGLLPAHSPLRYTHVPGRGLESYRFCLGCMAKRLLPFVADNLFEASTRYAPHIAPRHSFHCVQAVPGRGLEPPRLAVPAPKAGASTNFATPAMCSLYRRVGKWSTLQCCALPSK